MPLYTFRCRKCGQLTSVEHPYDEPHPATCPKMMAGEPSLCAGELVRVFDPPHITYRGSGFYSTDKALYPNGEDDEE